MNTSGMNIKDVLNEIEEFGFKQVLDIPFMNGNGTKEEHLYGYFHYSYGIFLQFDTYDGNHVNGGYYYYQWKPKSGLTKCHECFSSGGWVKTQDGYVWEGDGDCRTGMLESINALARDGKFITPWIKLSHMFRPTLVHYMDHHADDNSSWDTGYEMYKEALRIKTPERFKMLPLRVQKAIKKGMRINKED